jgi:3-oxoacyl-[acyl-carrier-protein] synthase-3
VHCDTTQHELCQSRGLETFMQTDSEELMKRGVSAGAETFAEFLDAARWERNDIDRTFCHQVGVAHRKLMFEALRLDPAIDFASVETLGNTGSAALPVTMALGIEQGRVGPGDRVAMLGIGSGINCLMLAAEWQTSPLAASRLRRRVAGAERSIAARRCPQAPG